MKVKKDYKNNRIAFSKVPNGDIFELDGQIFIKVPKALIEKSFVGPYGEPEYELKPINAVHLKNGFYNNINPYTVVHHYPESYVSVE